MSSLQDGLVGHWTMDAADSSGGTMYDRSAYDNHGAIVGSPSFTDSAVNESLQFSGRGEYIDIGTMESAQFFSGDSFTVSVWAIGDGQPSDYPMIISPESSASTNQIWSILQNDSSGSWSGNIQFRIQGTNSTNLVTTMPKGELTHLCMGYDADSNEAFVYKNGDEVKHGSHTFSPQASYPGDWTIGAGNSAGEYQWNGNIDDLRIYDRVLSDTEISMLSQQRAPRQLSPLSGLQSLQYQDSELVVDSDQYGDWICVQNYEHYGGTNPSVSPGSTFPSLPNGKSTAGDIESQGANGELQHVDQIDQYGITDVNAVRLEATTVNHSRKIHYFTEDQTVIDAIVADSTQAAHGSLRNKVTLYGDHTANLPNTPETNSTDGRSDRIFGYGFPMYEGGNHHWAVAGFGNRWEVDDYPGDSSQSTVHRVWVRVAGGL